MTNAEVVTSMTKGQLRGLITLLDDDAIQLAIVAAQQETGWTLPITGDFKCYWFVERSVRHALIFLLNANANKFKYKQINLNNRFAQYRDRIADMDLAWANADFPADTEAERIRRFGVVATTGFATDAAGQDRTFDPLNHVVISPTGE
jgi:hypothetical protein